ncbi:MAG: hypothetical protein Q8N76_05480 [Candidatus Omnitrophota bacterium]|nr:hypothetical protein [Candidatus Omnitrophota bacterium]
MKNARIFFLAHAISLFLIAGYVYPASFSLKTQPKSVNMGIVTASDYQNGFQEKIQANLLHINSNDDDWKVMVRTDDSSMGVIGSYTKPVSDLQWRAQGTYATQTTYTSVSNYDIEVARGPRGSVKNLFIDYKVLLSWAKDVPGDYYITLLYTLTTQ